MVLTIHASSTCDVCLEPYEWDDNNRRPHFITCGHVFCGTCLEQTQPKKCPLCRTLFSSSDVHRLNVDPYPVPDISQSDAEPNTPNPPMIDDSNEFANDLMKRLVMSYDSIDAELLSDVDAWIEKRDPDEDCPVRKARSMIRDHEQLKLRKTHDRRIIKSLQYTLQDSKKKSEESAARLAEEAQKQYELRRLLEESQKEAEKLREIQRSLLDAKAKKRKKPTPPPSNPLPAPPRHIGIFPSTWTHQAVDPDATPTASGFMTLSPAHNPIHAPEPRYPHDTHVQGPGIVNSYGLLTFNDRTGSTSKAKRHNHVDRGGLGPGQIVDGSAYWTCQTTNEVLPEMSSPQSERSKPSFDYLRSNTGRWYGV